MSLEGAATAERPEASPQAASTTRPAAARFAKLRVHLRNIYRLVIKELRGVRSDPIMPGARRLQLHRGRLRHRHRRSS